MTGSEWQKFRDHLARQLHFIERSCDAYDQGYTDEAIRISTQIRVILNPGGKKSRSLLQYLNSGRIPLLTTSEGAPERSDLVEYIGMGSLRFSSDGQTATDKYFPGLGEAIYHKYIRADRWWKQVVLFTEGTRYSRETIVRDAANKDGGAHVAATLTPEYERLITPGGIGDLVEVSGGVETVTPISDVHFVCICQMAYELLNSPELLKLPGYSPMLQAEGGVRSADDERGEDAQGELEMQDKTEAESQAEVHLESEVQRPRPPRLKLTNEDLERLREEVVRYFHAYYSELRSVIEKQGLVAGSEYIRGYRHILLELGNDGAVITHRSKEQGNEDTFEFSIVKDTSVRDLAAAKALKTPKGGTKRLALDYNFGEDFGQNTYLGPLVEQ